MPFTLDRVVPWGRSFDEYVAMFALAGEDLRARILGCGDGPAAFNAELTRRGGRVVSVDPLYRFDAGQIRRRIEETREEVLRQTRRHRDRFVWTAIPSAPALGRIRMAAMRAFLTDYPSGRRAGRYLAGELPVLPFGSGRFDLALCSHLLFLYSDRQTLDVHLRSLLELRRVAREVRIFPLLTLAGEPSPHVEPVAAAMRQRGDEAVIERVPYQFQRGGDRMMRIAPREQGRGDSEPRPQARAI